jgi:hypothetical protein
MGQPTLHIEPDRMRLCGPVAVEDERVSINGHILSAVVAECFGKALVETPGGGQERANWAEVTVVFSRRV